MYRDILGAVLYATLAAHIRGQNGAQFGDARAGTVAGVAILDRFVGRFGDVGRGGNIHIAQVKGIDFMPLGRPRRRRRRDGKGGFGTQFVQLFGELHGCSCACKMWLVSK